MPSLMVLKALFCPGLKADAAKGPCPRMPLMPGRKATVLHRLRKGFFAAGLLSRAVRIGRPSFEELADCLPLPRVAGLGVAIVGEPLAEEVFAFEVGGGGREHGRRRLEP